jgi:hypothetical protein
MAQDKGDTMQKTRAMRLIEAEHGGRPLRQILADLFAELETQEAVCKRLDITHPTLNNWLDLMGAKREQVRHYRTKVSFPDEQPVG